MKRHQCHDEGASPESPYLEQLCAPTTLSPLFEWRTPGESLWALDDGLDPKTCLWLHSTPRRYEA